MAEYKSFSDFAEKEVDMLGINKSNVIKLARGA